MSHKWPEVLDSRNHISLNKTCSLPFPVKLVFSLVVPFVECRANQFPDGRVYVLLRTRQTYLYTFANCVMSRRIYSKYSITRTRR